MTAKPGVAVAVPETISSVAEDHYCLKGEEFWFYDVMKKHQSGPTIYRYLLSLAEHEIWIWDPYLKDTDISLFDSIDEDVSIRILTSDYKGNETDICSRQLQGFANGLKVLLVRKNLDITLKFLNKNMLCWTNRTDSPHDRYLFVDDQVYMVGCSLQYHSVEGLLSYNFTGSGKWSIASTAVMKVTSEINKGILRNAFLELWNKNDKYVLNYTLE